MKVGDYVRTKWGDIERIVLIDNDNIIVDIEEDEEGREYSKMCYKDDIIKSSPNIIDLIEVGDYVNGSRVIEVNKDKETSYVSVEYSIFGKDEIMLALLYDEDDIKSIVTKEQFESMEYKVGGE